MKYQTVFRVISGGAFLIATLFLGVLIVSGVRVSDYWAELWRGGSNIKKLAEQAFLLYIISFVFSVLVEILEGWQRRSD